MKRILLTTTSLVLAAGVASAEVTFSGKMEAGISRTEEVKAGTLVAGRLTTSANNTSVTAASRCPQPLLQQLLMLFSMLNGVLTTTTAGGTLGAVVANAAAGAANVVSSVNYATQDVADKKAALADAGSRFADIGCYLNTNRY